MFIIYDIIFIVFACAFFPYTIIRGKWHSDFKIRFGCFPKGLLKTLKGKQCVWIHAVSVGEVFAVSDLIKQMRRTYPQYTYICSTVTKTGHALANELLGKDCQIIYAPLDFSWIVRRFISVIQPKIYVSTETEIWPNLYTALHKRGIPIIQINGRISDSAFNGYKLVRFLTRNVLACVNLFYMQTPADAERIKILGALPQRVFIAGNLKFDSALGAIDVRKEDFGFSLDEDLFIAGSTHPGEEDILIDVYKKLTNNFPKLRLVIAPRHIERVNELINLIEAQGYQAVQFSKINEAHGNTKEIIVVDTIGDLRKLYSLAKIVFIGKSLTVGGGQNIIESASFGKPTIVGPKTENFKDAVKLFLKSDALIQINNSEELFDVTVELLTDSQRSERIGRAAKETVMKHQGATTKTVDAITGLLGR